MADRVTTSAWAIVSCSRVHRGQQVGAHPTFCSAGHAVSAARPRGGQLVVEVRPPPSPSARRWSPTREQSPARRRKRPRSRRNAAWITLFMLIVSSHGSDSLKARGGAAPQQNSALALVPGARGCLGERLAACTHGARRARAGRPRSGGIGGLAEAPRRSTSLQHGRPAAGPERAAVRDGAVHLDDRPRRSAGRTSAGSRSRQSVSSARAVRRAGRRSMPAGPTGVPRAASDLSLLRGGQPAGSATRPTAHRSCASSRTGAPMLVDAGGHPATWISTAPAASGTSARSGQHAGRPGSPRSRVGRIQSSPAVAALPLVEDQVDHRHHVVGRRVARRPSGLRTRRAPPAGFLARLMRCPIVGLETRAASDLGGREPRDQPQGQRRPRLGVERVAGQEGEPQDVVPMWSTWSSRSGIITSSPRARARHLAAQGVGAAEVVDAAPLRGGHQPRGRVVRHAGGGPLLEGGDERILSEVLGERHVPGSSGGAPTRRADLGPPRGVDGLDGVVLFSRRHPPA